MLDQFSQKRRFLRLGEHVPVSYRVRGEQESHNTITENISIQGAGLKAESYIAPASPLMLELNIESRVVRAVGKVSWIANMPHSNRTRFGVEFIECDPLDSEYLADFIENRVNKRKDQA